VRKARAWLFQHITGQEIADGELDAPEPKTVKGTVIKERPGRFDNEPAKTGELL
jgi:hypothetical protein